MLQRRICYPMPACLRRHLEVRGVRSAASAQAARDADGQQPRRDRAAARRVFERAGAVARLVASLCCTTAELSAHSGGAPAQLNEAVELTGRQVVECLEFRGWYGEGAGAAAAVDASAVDIAARRDSTPYFLCCWLHYRATPAMRRQFLRFTTCVPHVPADGGRVVVERDPERLLARTCLRTLHLPPYATLADLTESLELALHVMELDAALHE